MIRRILGGIGQVGGILLNAARARSEELDRLRAELRGAREWCDRLAKVAQTANRQAMDASREREEMERDLRALRRIHEEAEKDHAEAIERRAEVEAKLAEVMPTVSAAVTYAQAWQAYNEVATRIERARRRATEDEKRELAALNTNRAEVHVKLLAALGLGTACGRAEA